MQLVYCRKIDKMRKTILLLALASLIMGLAASEELDEYEEDIWVEQDRGEPVGSKVEKATGDHMEKTHTGTERNHNNPWAEVKRDYKRLADSRNWGDRLVVLNDIVADEISAASNVVRVTLARFGVREESAQTVYLVGGSALLCMLMLWLPWNQAILVLCLLFFTGAKYTPILAIGFAGLNAIWRRRTPECQVRGMVEDAVQGYIYTLLGACGIVAMVYSTGFAGERMVMTAGVALAVLVCMGAAAKTITHSSGAWDTARILVVFAIMGAVMSVAYETGSVTGMIQRYNYGLLFSGMPETAKEDIILALSVTESERLAEEHGITPEYIEAIRGHENWADLLRQKELRSSGLVKIPVVTIGRSGWWLVDTVPIWSTGRDSEVLTAVLMTIGALIYGIILAGTTLSTPMGYWQIRVAASHVAVLKRKAEDVEGKNLHDVVMERVGLSQVYSELMTMSITKGAAILDMAIGSYAHGGGFQFLAVFAAFLVGYLGVGPVWWCCQVGRYWTSVGTNKPSTATLLSMADMGTTDELPILHG